MMQERLNKKFILCKIDFEKTHDFV